MGLGAFQFQHLPWQTLCIRDRASASPLPLRDELPPGPMGAVRCTCAAVSCYYSAKLLNPDFRRRASHLRGRCCHLTRCPHDVEGPCRSTDGVHHTDRALLRRSAQASLLCSRSRKLALSNGLVSALACRGTSVGRNKPMTKRHHECA